MTDHINQPTNDGGAKPADATASDPFSRFAAAMYGKPTDDRAIAHGTSEGIRKEELTKRGSEPGIEERAALRDVIAQELAKFEGIDTEHATTKEFTDLASQLGLDGEKAKKLAEFDQRRTGAAWDEIGDRWLSEAERSPTFDADISLGNDLLRQYGSPELLQDFTTFRIGNHPHMIQFLGRIGRAMRANRR